MKNSGWGFLVSKRWLGYYGLLIVFAIFCVFLGNWQFARRAEAQAEIARIDSNYDAAPIPLSDALPTLDFYDNDSNKWHPVTVEGSYVGEPFIARNRPANGQVGSNILHALQLPGGQIVFVDRGWVSLTGIEAAANPSLVAKLPRPSAGTVTVTGRLRQAEPLLAGREPTGRTVPSIVPEQLAGLAGFSGRVFSSAYMMLISETPAGETGLLPRKPERDEGPHLSYALQWYVFIGIAGVGLVFAARREYRSVNAGSATLLRADAKRRSRRAGKRLSDSEEEDALLGQLD